MTAPLMTSVTTENRKPNKPMAPMQLMSSDAGSVLQGAKVKQKHQGRRGNVSGVACKACTGPVGRATIRVCRIDKDGRLL